MQTLDLVDFQFSGLLDGQKTDTIRMDEGMVSEGFLKYVEYPSKSREAIVFVTNVQHIPLREAVRLTKDMGPNPTEEMMLEKMRFYYPDITLDSIVMYVTHLTPDETAKQFAQELAEINATNNQRR